MPRRRRASSLESLDPVQLQQGIDYESNKKQKHQRSLSPDHIPSILRDSSNTVLSLSLLLPSSLPLPLLSRLSLAVTIPLSLDLLTTAKPSRLVNLTVEDNENS